MTPPHDWSAMVRARAAGAHALPAHVVMPAGFTFPDDVDVWLRLNWDLTQHSSRRPMIAGSAL